MGRMESIESDRQANTRRKEACHRRVQKSASEMAVNGASNIGGQLSGWLPSETKRHEMKVYGIVIERTVWAHTDVEKMSCSYHGRLVIGKGFDRSQVLDLSIESNTSRARF